VGLRENAKLEEKALAGAGQTSESNLKENSPLLSRATETSTGDSKKGRKHLTPESQKPAITVHKEDSRGISFKSKKGEGGGQAD